MTDPATAEDRMAAIRARLDAATEGPWIHEPSEVLHGTEDVRLHYVSDQAAIADDDPPMCSFYSRADAEFVAHAREDVPFLLSELEAAQARLSAAAEVHKPERRYVTPDNYEGSYDDPQWIAEAWEIPIDEVEFFEVCSHCGAIEMRGSVDYKDSLWPCADARALGLGEEGDDGE